MFPATAIEELRWLGVIALSGMLATALLLLVTQQFDPSSSVSQSWSRSKRAFLFMGISMSVFGALLCVSLLGWTIPHYGLPVLLYPLVLLAYLALLVIAWVPMVEKPGEHSWLHPHFLGGGVVATGALVGFLLILQASPPVPPVSYWLTVLALAYGLLWPVFMLEKVRKYFLVLEIGLVLMFVQVTVALAAGV